ncbi:MAG: hypothetical protein ACR2OC_04245 [Solirubrobacterales bacterium]
MDQRRQAAVPNRPGEPDVLSGAKLEDLEGVGPDRVVALCYERGLRAAEALRWSRELDAPLRVRVR